MQRNDAMTMKPIDVSFPLQHIRAQVSHQPRLGIKMSTEEKKNASHRDAAIFTGG